MKSKILVFISSLTCLFVSSFTTSNAVQQFSNEALVDKAKKVAEKVEEYEQSALRKQTRIIELVDSAKKSLLVANEGKKDDESEELKSILKLEYEARTGFVQYGAISWEIKAAAGEAEAALQVMRAADNRMSKVNPACIQLPVRLQSFIQELSPEMALERSAALSRYKEAEKRLQESSLRVCKFEHETFAILKKLEADELKARELKARIKKTTQIKREELLY